MMPVSATRFVSLAYTGELEQLSQHDRLNLFSRTSHVAGGRNEEVSLRTREIIEAVRTRGDAALLEYAQQFDGVALDSIEVPRALWMDALDSMDASLRSALERAARNIRVVHEAMRPRHVVVSPEPGVTIERVPQPLNRVGVYAPGGRATYPSSVLMGAIPARVAGVSEVVVCSPPGSSGFPPSMVLAAAQIANVDRVFSVGGAGAIAAMALGTSTIPQVDRIVGPGNVFVSEAKMQLANRVGIDVPAGPSEVLVLADDSADSNRIAQELIAQAEHDPNAAVVALLWGEKCHELATAVCGHLTELVKTTERRVIVEEALAGYGAVLTCESASIGVEFANQWGAEHVIVLVGDDNVRTLLTEKLRNAGTVFTGEGASVAFGDYITGANHVLPTGGMSRAYSGLSTLDFIRWTTFQHIDGDAARSFRDDTVRMANAEGLPAHADAARLAARGSGQ